MSSEGIRVAAHQVVGVSARRSDRWEAGFIPLDTRVNPGRKTDLLFQLGKKSNLRNSLVFGRTSHSGVIKIAAPHRW